MCRLTPHKPRRSLRQPMQQPSASGGAPHAKPLSPCVPTMCIVSPTVCPNNVCHLYTLYTGPPHANPLSPCDPAPNNVHDLRLCALTQGAETVVYAATAPDLSTSTSGDKSVGGATAGPPLFLHDKKPVTPAVGGCLRLVTHAHANTQSYICVVYMGWPLQLMSALASCCGALRVAIVFKIHTFVVLHAQAAATDERRGKLL